MKKSERPFLSVGSHTLYMDLVLAEYRDPILFTCLDEAGDMYLAACYRADGQERSWLIAETTPHQVYDLLRDRVTIREAFPKGRSPVWEAVLRRGEASPSVRRRRAEEIPESFFPTPGMYMEGDEEEFREELAVLRRRVLDRAKMSRYVSAAGPRGVTFRMAPVSQSWQTAAAAARGVTFRISPAFRSRYVAAEEGRGWAAHGAGQNLKELRSCYACSC